MRNVINTYLACLFPIQVWSIYNLLHEVPGWSLQLNVWDLLGAVSYTQVFVLFESIVIFLLLLFLSVLLPAGWFKAKFVALSTAIVYLSAVWFILAHLNDVTLYTWGPKQLLPWIGLFLFSQILFFSLIHANQKLESVIVSFVNQVAVLSTVYLLFDLLGVLIIVIRNI